MKSTESAIVWRYDKPVTDYLEWGWHTDWSKFLHCICSVFSREDDRHGKGGFVPLGWVLGMASLPEGKQNH